MQFEARFPYALMIAPLPAWTKTLWIAIRGFQGAGSACRASYASIGERCINEAGNPMDPAQISRGVSMLIDAGFLERIAPRKLRCTTPQTLTSDQQNLTRDQNYEGENVDQESTKLDEGSTNHADTSSQTLTSDQQVLTSDQQNIDQGSRPSENQQENQQGKPTGESPPPAPAREDDPGDDAPHPAVGMYRRIMHLSLNDEQAALVRSRVTDFSLWKETLTTWKLNGWRKTNVPGLVDRYENGNQNLRTDEQNHPFGTPSDENTQRLVRAAFGETRDDAGGVGG